MLVDRCLVDVAGDEVQSVGVKGGGGRARQVETGQQQILSFESFKNRKNIFTLISKGERLQERGYLVLAPRECSTCSYKLPQYLPSIFYYWAGKVPDVIG